MNHLIVWSEIPVTDINRAKSFYAEVFDVSFKDSVMEEYQMAIFDVNEEQVAGALVKGPNYLPSKQAAVIYFNGGEDLAEPLQRAQARGAEVVWPKTAISDASGGYYAQFIDCEGNRIGLYSPK